jgi:NADH-quinone oxidoreductase subunit M
MQLFDLSSIPFAALSLAVLFIGALLIYAFKDSLEKSAGRVAVGVSAVASLLMVYPFYQVFTGTTYEEYATWSGLLEQFGLKLDNIAFPITFAVVVLGFLSVVYAVGYTEHSENKPTFFANTLFFLMGMQWVTLATNLIEFFIAWELMLVPSYFLILFWGLPETRKRTAMKFWLYTQSGAVCILVGFGILYSLTGSFDLALIQPGIDALTLGATLPGLGITIGTLLKLVLFPIHWWLPPVHAEAPTPISVLLSGAMIETGAYALMRFGLITLSDAAIALSFFVAALGVITMFYGGFMALAQVDIKRLLAYSSVSQMGYVLFALGVYSPIGAAGGMFHTKMGGLSNKMPITAFAAAIGMMSIAGSPPLSGFASEWMMFLGGFERAVVGGAIASFPFLILTIIAVSSSILSAGYMLRFFWKVFLGPHPDELEDVKESSNSMTIPMIILGILIVIFGIFPGLALDVIVPAVQGILVP